MKQGICAEKYPQHNLPCRQIFANIHRYIRGKCSFVKNTVDLGRPVTVRRLKLEKAFLIMKLKHIQKQSKRKIARTLNVVIR